MKEASVFFQLEQFRRDTYLEEHEWSLSSRMETIRKKYHGRSTIIDPALIALDAIIENGSNQNNAKKSRSVDSRERRKGARKVMMPYAQAPPKYDAWIPVKANHWVGKELNLEPYMPFLGDQDQDCERAFEVFEDMAVGAQKEIDLSDGEVTKEGKFRMPKDDIDRVDYHSLAQMRWREGSRKAISVVLDQFVQFDDVVWHVLATALGIDDLRRIKAIAKVAQERRTEHETRVERRKRYKKKVQEHARELRNPQDDDMSGDEGRASTGVMNFFCLTCHVFACPQHEPTVEPIIRIEDMRTTERERLLKQNLVTPCSQECFLNQNDAEPGLQEKWCTEEILCLRASIPIFGLDPCSIAHAVGSKSCRNIQQRLADPIEADIARCELEKARRSRRFDPSKRGTEGLEKNKRKGENKTIVETYDPSSIDQDFSPCCHVGPCTQETCSCVKNATHCESTCGCKSGRFAEGGETGGIIWHPSPSRRKGGPPRGCQNRHYGCGCFNGHCNTSLCSCWEQHRACSPDFCDCDCMILPHHISVRKRKCKNTPASVAQHKRTFIGKSDVHGYGIFAGENFETGDLVGVYSGQLIDTRLADVIGRLYDATERTYIFNVTESLVIDGGLLGSKAKFINHTKPGEGENCGSRLVRVRGDAYVALFCKRAVATGEEFLFDYRFAGEIPAWASDEKGKALKK